MEDETEYTGEFGGEYYGEGERSEEDEEDSEDEAPPPPRGEPKELLFLIEFLVDTLSLCPENLNLDGIDPCALQGPTSVVLTFLHFPPMALGEKDADPDRRTGGNVIQYNSGKSLMFALTESQFEEPPAVFLFMTAVRDMPHAFRFSQLHIGKAKIDLSELFRQLFEKYDEYPKKTVSKSIKDWYALVGEDGKPTAEVSLYIRLTCLGENIVTEFQKGEDPEEPMLFKNKESNKVYECRETERPDEEEGKKLPGWGDGKKCDHRGAHQAPPDPDDENFEEIFAEINGSAIRVKVEKSKRKDPPKPFHVSEFCDCDIPLPHDLVAGMSDLSLSRVSEGSVNFPANGAESSGDAVMGGGGGGGGGPDPTDKRVALDDANQLIFNVPPVEALAAPGGKNTLVYNVNTCQDGTRHGHKAGSSYRVITDNNLDGPPPKVPNDPEKDVFILRIIKRGKSDTGKGSLSLEFKTPKEKIEAPKRKPYFVEAGVGPEKTKKK